MVITGPRTVFSGHLKQLSDKMVHTPVITMVSAVQIRQNLAPDIGNRDFGLVAGALEHVPDMEHV